LYAADAQLEAILAQRLAALHRQRKEIEETTDEQLARFSDQVRVDVVIALGFFASAMMTMALI
jgi:predicted negative regulator of RcsB-dependent stress response